MELLRRPMQAAEPLGPVGVTRSPPKGNLMLGPNPALKPILSGAIIRSRIAIWVIGAMVLFLGFGAGMWIIGSENANPPVLSSPTSSPR